MARKPKAKLITERTLLARMNRKLAKNNLGLRKEGDRYRCVHLGSDGVTMANATVNLEKFARGN